MESLRKPAGRSHRPAGVAPAAAGRRGRHAWMGIRHVLCIVGSGERLLQPGEPVPPSRRRSVQGRASDWRPAFQGATRGPAPGCCEACSDPAPVSLRSQQFSLSALGLLAPRRYDVIGRMATIGSREQLSAHHRRVRALAAMGRCAGPCGERWAGGVGDPYCTNCTARRRAQRRRVRERRIESGLCTECGKRPPLPGRKYCAPCQQRTRRARKRLYCRRKRSGRCTNCGRAAECHPLTTCKLCRKLSSDRRLHNSNGR